MKDARRLGSRFRQAVAAIDAGDALTLERLLAEHPELVRDRLRSPGQWLREQIGAALDGFFKNPYSLWFVTEDAVRTGQLSVHVAEVARVTIQAARHARCDGLAAATRFNVSLCGVLTDWARGWAAA